MKKFNFIIMITLVLLTTLSWKVVILIRNLEIRVSRIEQALQRDKPHATVEIKVERAFDEDLRLWGYKLIGTEETFAKQMEEGGRK